MADLFVAMPQVTAYGGVVFGKNSNRPASEVQDVIYSSAQDHSDGTKIKCTYIEVAQVSHTHAVVLSKPSWMWGAEMGANEKGVAIGNAPVWTKLNGPQDLEKKLLGTDIVRLTLERASSAREAVDIISHLLSTYGQGGPCTDEPGKEGWSFHNSFLIADRNEAWVLETAGDLWAAEHVTDGVRNISNELSIRTKMDLMSPELVQNATKLGFYSEDKGAFDFKSAFCAQSMEESGVNSTSFRFRHGKEMMEKVIADAKFTYQDMFDILRDEDGGICMMDGGFITSGSQVSVLLPESTPSPDVHWFTGTPNPTTSIYKPFFFGPGADIGSITVSPRPDATEEDQATEGHALYKGHKRLCSLMDTQEEKGHNVLAQLRELEKKCCEDVDEILASYIESNFPKLKQIFQHMASMEINFYH